MKDIDYIKNFSKISITKICEENNINRQNLLNGKTTKKNEHIVRTQIEHELAKLYLIVGEDNE